MSESHSGTRRVARLQTLLNATEDPILLVDGSGTIIEGNRTAARMLGPDSRRLAGRSIFDMPSDEPGLVEKAMVDEVWQSGRPKQWETFREGRFFELKLHPVFDGEGVMRAIAVYAHDVTEARLMEAALRQTEEKYRKIFENATEGIFQLDVDGRILSANPAFARIHGFNSPEELIGRVPDIARLYAEPEKRKELMRLLGKFGHVENFEVRMLRPDGSIGWISVSVRLVRDNKGKPLYHEGTMRDITKRKEAEEALRESEDRYRTAVEHSNDGIAIIQGGKHVYVNTRFVEMFEYSKPEEIVGLPVVFNVHPDDRERVLSISDQRQQGEPAPLCYEFKGVTRTGAIIHIEVSATNMTYGGKPVSFVYLRDITDRKRAEEALIESRNELERLNRAKSKAVDHISHELRTPLALVQANVRILRQRLEAGPGAESTSKFLDMLERNVNRLFEIADEAGEILRASHDLEVSGLMDEMDRLEQRMESLAEVPKEMRAHMGEVKAWLDRHMSGSRGRFRLIELLPFVESTVERVRHQAGKREVSIVIEGGERVLSISMNPAILREVLEALLKNAIEATPDGGRICVRLEERAGKAYVHVIDTGVGISEEDQPYIFDGLFHATETDLYSSKRPYDFGAGGKGLDLLKVKVYSKRYGFDVSMSSKRCPHVPTEGDQCPGDAASCPYAHSADGCGATCGSTFSLSFRASSEEAGLGERRQLTA
jgi:PAS domain S-box-containing protein